VGATYPLGPIADRRGVACFVAEPAPAGGAGPKLLERLHEAIRELQPTTSTKEATAFAARSITREPSHTDCIVQHGRPQREACFRGNRKRSTSTTSNLQTFLYRHRELCLRNYTDC